MASYELVYIVSPTISDEELPNVLRKISEYVTKVGGSVGDVTQWGRKKLSYPIKKSVEGNYVLARIELKPTATKELESTLKMSNEVIRHLLIRANV